jgi:outer membrane protein assembly factor BamB
VLHDGRLLLVTAEGHGLSVDPANGELVHRARLEGRTGAVYASPVVAADRLYVTSRKRGSFVYSADGAFKLLAHNQLGDASQCNASPAVAGDALYLRSDKALYGLRSGGKPTTARPQRPPRAGF